jgi:hypothetical protein
MQNVSVTKQQISEENDKFNVIEGISAVIF